MSARARVRDAKKAATEPFATIRQDVLLVIALTLPGRAARIYWLANASWTPTERRWGAGVESGTARLSVSYLKAPHRPNRRDEDIVTPSSSTIAKGLRLLLPADGDDLDPGVSSKGYLTLNSPGVRPGSQGGATGMAAEYDIPHRHSTNVPPVTMPPNVRRPDGKLRQHAGRIRRDIARMTESEVTVFTYAVAHRDRSKEGALKDLEPFPLPLSALTEALGIPRATAADAIRGLVKKGLLIVVDPARGRRTATFRLPPAWEKFTSPRAVR